MLPMLTIGLIEVYWNSHWPLQRTVYITLLMVLNIESNSSDCLGKCTGVRACPEYERVHLSKVWPLGAHLWSWWCSEVGLWSWHTDTWWVECFVHFITERFKINGVVFTKKMKAMCRILILNLGYALLLNYVELTLWTCGASFLAFSLTWNSLSGRKTIFWF